MNFATTKERIIQFIENQGISIKDFLETTEIKRGFLDSDKLKASVSDIFITKIVAKYPYINLEWLITGNGSMLKTDNNNIVAEPVATYRKTKDAIHPIQRVPVFNLEAEMGLVPLVNGAGGSIDEEKVIDYISIPTMPACDGAIYASGDSMYPLLKSGDMIAYKKIDVNRNNIFFGEIYLLAIYIDETTTMKTIKFVHPSELGDEYIKLVSHNQHHAPRDIKLTQIAAMGLVRASIRIHN